MTETPDERAARLVDIGLDVAVRIRDESPADVARALDGLEQTELRDMVLLLAAAVDVGVSHAVLYGWWTGQPRELRPCGTQAAVSAHRRRREPLDAACRMFQRDRKRAERAAA